MSPPQHPSLAIYDRDSTAVRASVFDACLQLGALDENSLVGQWMFNDPSTDTDDSLQTKNRTTRFQEVVSGDWSNDGVVKEQSPEPRQRRGARSFFSFSAFSARRRRGSSARLSQEHDPDNLANPNTNSSSSSSSVHDIGPGYVSLNRRSFFRRSVDKHATRSTSGQDTIHSESTTSSDRLSSSHRSFFSRRSIQQQQSTADQANVNEDGSVGRVSTNPRSFFHLKPSTNPSSNPLGSVPEDDDGDEEEWEEIEARPRSPLYPLHNKGINPPAVTPDNKGKKRQSTAAAAAATTRSTTDTPTSVNTDVAADAAQVDIRGAKVQSLSFAIPRLMFRRQSLEHARSAHDHDARQRRSSSPTSPSEPRSRPRTRTWSWSRASKSSPPPNRKANTPSPTSTPPRSTPPSSVSPRKPRKRKSKPSHLRVFTGRPSSARYYHRHSRSGSTSPGLTSPFVLLTTDNTSTMPQPTSRIVFSGEDNPPPAPPHADTEAVAAAETANNATRGGMGYHHQFFMNNDGSVAEPALPALPPSSPASPRSPHYPSSPTSPTYSSSSPGSPGSTRRRRLTKTRRPRSAAVAAAAASNSSPTTPLAIAAIPAPSPAEAVVPVRPPKRASGGPVLRKRAAVPFPPSSRR